MPDKVLVSGLIFDVLTGKKSVSQALSLFPKNTDDIDIKCAFDALVHREADEDLRKKVKGYAYVQDEYLVDIAEILRKNLPLPKNIVAKYLKFHSDDLLAVDDKMSLKNILKKIKRMINF